MIDSQNVMAILSATYMINEYQESLKNILAVAKKVSTELGGGKYGHTWLVTNRADLKNYRKTHKL